MATLPVTTATSERSFSTLKRVKTSLRSSMTDERCTGLALMNIYKDVASQVNIQQVLNNFAMEKRRMNL